MDFVTTAKGAALSIAIQQITGSPPVISDHDSYVEIKLSPDQQIKIRAWLEKQMSAEPGDLRIDLLPVIIPIAIKKILPFVLGAAVLGYVIGRL